MHATKLTHTLTNTLTLSLTHVHTLRRGIFFWSCTMLVKNLTTHRDSEEAGCLTDDTRSVASRRTAVM